MCLCLLEQESWKRAGDERTADEVEGIGGSAEGTRRGRGVVPDAQKTQKLGKTEMVKGPNQGPYVGTDCRC